MKIIRRKLFWIAMAIVFLTGGYAWHEYRAFMSVPTARLTAGNYYPEMPPDEHHYYIQLPIDHDDPSLGTFIGFYLLSPSFKAGSNVVFKLYDNQQEAVGMIRDYKDFEIFDQGIGKDISYVLIGNRGVSPTLFPEVFDKNGNADYALALKLYGSDEQIEDIENVRLDMVKRGLLPKDGKIILHGGSGGGVLIQQYLSKHGQHVSRVLMESTGAPDIAQANQLTFTKSFYSSNREAAEIYYKLYQEGDTNTSLAWLLFKVGLEGQPQLQTRILKGKDNTWDLPGKFLYAKNWLKLSNNFPLISMIFRSPVELEVKVRMWELLGYDLVNYNPSSAEEINLLYESSRIFLSEFQDAYKTGQIPIYDFNINRSDFNGEVMVWANSGDQDFGPQIAELITAAYPHARLAVFEENAHRVQKKSAYQLNLIKSFIETGPNSPETQKCFDEDILMK
ncbi:MAG: hypothetical protein PHC92_11060 [Syntrophomonadaceae bacterium]|nr:hypothetical protein [Syntrophomonadaceae bacterium]MDD3023094.1 hypothetical protein [Syntrophomonadaceae bacterium]